MKLYGLLLFLLLASCANPVVKQPSILSNDKIYSDKALKLAELNFQEWDDTKSHDDLLAAWQQYDLAMTHHGDNANVQIKHYLSLYSLADKDWPVWGERLKQAYEKLNKLALHEVKPAALLEYYKNQSDDKVAQIKRYLKEVPTSFEFWYELSLAYSSIFEYELSLASALNAYQYAPKNSYLSYRVGSSYFDLWQDLRCDGVNFLGLEKAIKYLSPLINDNELSDKTKLLLSNIFSKLALDPIGRYLIDSIDIDDLNVSQQYYLAKILFWQKKYQESQKILQQLDYEHAPYWMALIFASEGRWAEYENMMSEYLNVENQFISFFAFHKYLVSKGLVSENLLADKISGHTENEIDCGENWFEKAGCFVSGKNISSDLLYKKATNRCQKGKSYFYIGLKKVSDGFTSEGLCLMKKAHAELPKFYIEELFLNIIFEQQSSSFNQGEFCG